MAKSSKQKEDKDLMTTLIELHTKHPNDMNFGGEVRQIVWQHIQDNSPAY